MAPIAVNWDVDREANQARVSGHNSRAGSPAEGSEPPARQPTPPAGRVERGRREREGERNRRSPAPEQESPGRYSDPPGGTAHQGQAASVRIGAGGRGLPVTGRSRSRSSTPPARRVTRTSRNARHAAAQGTAAATGSTGAAGHGSNTNGTSGTHATHGTTSTSTATQGPGEAGVAGNTGGSNQGNFHSDSGHGALVHNRSRVAYINSRGQATTDGAWEPR